jgi:hypothetical protein
MMLIAPLLRRSIAATLVAALLAGCASLAEVELPRPTPVPLIARLASVTPALPTPTDLPPLPTLTLSPPTPTLGPVLAAVKVGANVRGGPGTTFEIVGVVTEGAEVTVLGSSAAWYLVEAPGGVSGWMINEVLELPAGAKTRVPTVNPQP